MGRLAILFLTLLAPAVAGAASWTKVAAEKNADVLADTSSIRKGKVTKMTHVRDYRTPAEWSGTKYSSEKYVVDYDCEGRRSGISDRRFYTGPMGTGSMFNYGATSGPPMKPVAAGTLDDALWKLACSAK